MNVNLLAQPGQLRVGDALVGELIEECRAVGEGDRKHVVDAELPLQSCARLGQSGRGPHVVVDVGVDGCDVVGGQAVLGTQLEKRLRGRVGQRAAGIRLESVARQIPDVAEALDRPLG